MRIDKRFRNYADSAHFRLWSKLFTSAGIEYSLPCAGVSEVGTSIILQKTSFDRVAQSCIRGEWKKPCLNCWKCFRKEMLQSSLNEQDGSIEKISEILFQSRETKIKLLDDKPIKHECILTYALSNIDKKSSALITLSELVRSDSIESSWMERWYGKSKTHIDENHRQYTSDKLDSILGTMDSRDESNAESWENEHNDARQLNWEKLNSLLN